MNACDVPKVDAAENSPRWNKNLMMGCFSPTSRHAIGMLRYSNNRKVRATRFLNFSSSFAEARCDRWEYTTVTRATGPIKRRASMSFLE